MNATATLRATRREPPLTLTVEGEVALCASFHSAAAIQAARRTTIFEKKAVFAPTPREVHGSRVSNE
jgi:hypothetical protein